MSNLPMLEEIGEEAEFIAVSLSYHDALLFPVDQGLEYIKSLRGCLKLKTEGYGNDRTEKILRFEDDIKVQYFTKEHIQEIVAGQELLLRGNES